MCEGKTEWDGVRLNESGSFSFRLCVWRFSPCLSHSIVKIGCHLLSTYDAANTEIWLLHFISNLTEITNIPMRKLFTHVESSIFFIYFVITFCEIAGNSDKIIACFTYTTCVHLYHTKSVVSSGAQSQSRKRNQRLPFYSSFFCAQQVILRKDPHSNRTKESTWRKVYIVQAHNRWLLLQMQYKRTRYSNGIS